MQNNNFDHCKHDWNYKVEINENDNIYIEICNKCFKTIKTHELFNEENF
jgi:hypothetical protein